MNLIFDLDGTLIDSRPGIVESLSFATSKTLGKGFDADLLKIGPPINIMIEQVFPGASDRMVEKVVECFRKHYDSIGWGIYNTYPKVKDVLEILDEKNILFIATNKPKNQQKKSCSIWVFYIYLRKLFVMIKIGIKIKQIWFEALKGKAMFYTK